MSNQEFNDNTGTAEVEDGAVDGTAGVVDEDAAAPVDILDTTVPTRRPHPDRRTREARREAVRTRSISAAPASVNTSPAAVRPAAFSMAKRLAVPPCMSDLGPDQKKTVDMTEAELVLYHGQARDAGVLLEKKQLFSKDPSEPGASFDTAGDVKMFVCLFVCLFG